MEALLNLELVHEHRNYLPVLGPIMAVAACLTPSREVNRIHLGRLGTGLVALALLAGATLATAERATVWGQSVLWGLSEALHHPRSARAHLQAAMSTTLAARRLQRQHQERAAAMLYGSAREHLQQARHLDNQAVVADFGLLLLDGLQHRDTPAEQLLSLRQRLATGPVHISLSSVLERFVEWQQQGLTRLPHQEAIGLFEAALSNPRTPAQVRGMENALLGKYYAEMLHDGKKALYYTIAATRADPGAYQHQLSLASLALQLGNAALARQALQRAAGLDPLHRGTVRRRELLDALVTLEQGRQKQKDGGAS
jgi:tetratricopeptide (TPR) repeat protein